MKFACLLGGVFSAWLQAQPASSTATPKFEVVSVKRCRLGSTRGGDSSPGRLSIGCALLADVDNTGLIQQAYNRYAGGRLNSMKLIPIEGGPEWIHSEAFGIDARSEGQPSMLTMLGPMMQAILEDRFKLRIHRETREGPVYELVSGKGISRLQPLQEGKCTPVIVGQALPALAAGEGYCRNMAGPRAVDLGGGTLSTFAGLMGMILDRPVIDKTGMTNYFEIHLKFSPEDSATAADAPGIFQAIQEQLGLRLVPAKGPVDVLVIDHVERPTEN